jgi:predicted site-specific integrase-resolvase
VSTTDRISTGDAEATYGIPARTLRRWRQEGRITEPVTKNGQKWWLLSEIDQLAQLRGRNRLPRRPVMTDHSG